MSNNRSDLTMPNRLVSLSLFTFVLVCIACAHPSGISNSFEPPIDFIDHTEHYKGRELTFRLTLDAYRWKLDTGDTSLRSRFDPEVKFYAYAGSSSAKLEITINIPPSLTVPAAQYLDELLVTFVCKDGKLNSGNDAKKIERAP